MSTLGVGSEIRLVSSSPNSGEFPLGIPSQPLDGGDRDREFEESEVCLDLSKDVIEGKASKIKAKKLESGKLLNLKVLFLNGNAGDLGARAMLNALSAGHLKGLEKLILLEVSSYDQLTTEEAGTDTIEKGIRGGNLPNLVLMDLTGSLPKVIKARIVSTVLRDMCCSQTLGKGRFAQFCNICFGCLCATPLGKGKDQTLECFRCISGRLDHNSGDVGVGKIAKALRQTPITTLEILLLQENHIRSNGAEEIANLLESGALPKLSMVDLRNNPVGHRGANKLVLAFLKNPLLTARVKLDWPSSLVAQKAIAFRENNIRLEHMMETLDILPDQLLGYEDFNYFVEYRLNSRKEGLFRKKFVRKLGLLCQADYDQFGDDTREFKDHDINERRPDHDITESGPDHDMIESGPHQSVGGIEVKRFLKYSVNCSKYSSLNKTQFVQRNHRAARTGEAEGTTELSKVITITADHRVYANIVDNYGVGSTKATDHGKQKMKMQTIKEELLMLAESRPHDFYGMFGLRQVLLKNRWKDYKYSRLWICESCFQKYDRTPKLVQPITTDTELNRTPHSRTRNGQS